MKLLTLSIVMASQAFVLGSQGLCQETKQPDRPYLVHAQSSRLYFTVPSTERTGRVELAASSAQRNLSRQPNLASTDIESVLLLRGNVEVMVCPPGGHGCDHGSMVLHADAVDYNEKTREIDAHGNVRIMPYRDR